MGYFAKFLGISAALIDVVGLGGGSRGEGSAKAPCSGWIR